MRLRVALILLPVLLVGCASIDRPEGVVERWLRSINQGKIGEPHKYADDDVSDKILRDRSEPDGLDVIEVGKGRVTAGSALVPYRVHLTKGGKLLGVAELERSSGTWRILRLQPADPKLKVPTQGGERIGKAALTHWGTTIVLAFALIFLTLAIMELVKRSTRGGAPASES